MIYIHAFSELCMKLTILVYFLIPEKAIKLVFGMKRAINGMARQLLRNQYMQKTSQNMGEHLR
jgi:hypothetical protein